MYFFNLLFNSNVENIFGDTVLILQSWILLLVYSFCINCMKNKAEFYQIFKLQEPESVS